VKQKQNDLSFVENVRRRLLDIMDLLSGAVRRFDEGRVDNGVNLTRRASQAVRDCLQLFEFLRAGVWSAWRQNKIKERKKESEGESDG